MFKNPPAMQETQVPSLVWEDSLGKGPTPVFLPGASMDRGAWTATVHRVAQSWTQMK